MSSIEKIVTTYAWQKTLGHDVHDTGLRRIVRDLENPHIWDANHVSLIRASALDEIDRVFDDAAFLLKKCGHSVFHIDPMAPPQVEARLVAADYEDHTPILQMVLSGDLKATPKSVDIRAIQSDADWHSLGEMMHENFIETGPEITGEIARGVSLGCLAANRLKAPDFQFFIVRADGHDCAYGGGGFCPDGMGIVEDIFTRPAFRRRGMATAVIAEAVDFARSSGAKDVLIGTSTKDAVKHFYEALGFEPACVTRQYIKEK